MENSLVFVCGFASSGTDLLKNIMNAHPDIFIAGEFPFLPSLARRYGATIPGDRLEELTEDLRRIDVHHILRNSNVHVPISKAEYSLSEVYSYLLSDRKVKWKGNKTPNYTWRINRLRVLFPEAKFIVIIRDVRDVAISWNKKWGKDKLVCASKWNGRMRLGYDFLRELEVDRYLIVKYEDVLDGLKSQVDRICRFLGVKKNENMLEFHKYVEESLPGKINYGREILKNNKEKWRKEMPREEVMRIEEIAFESLKLFGYPITMASEHRPLTRTERYRGWAWDIAALIFVGNRAIRKNRIRHRLKTIIFEIRKILSHG